MANSFMVEWTEKGTRMSSRVDIGNFDGSASDAQREIESVIWPACHPERSGIKVVGVIGAGMVVRVTAPAQMTPAADAVLAAKKLKEVGAV